jgi:hypothetical protein
MGARSRLAGRQITLAAATVITPPIKADEKRWRSAAVLEVQVAATAWRR